MFPGPVLIKRSGVESEIKQEKKKQTQHKGINLSRDGEKRGDGEKFIFSFRVRDKQSRKKN